MNTKHISIAFVAVAALLAGCAKNSFEESIDGQSADLELSYVGATEVKSAIDGTDFPQTGEIGLFLFEDEQATKAYGTGYENVKYSYNSTKGKWTADPAIKVGGTPGYLYGYYPYCSTATDIKAIPVSSSLNGDDVMYAEKQAAITDKTAANTAITMNHALARVAITVINKGYTGNAELSQIKFEGAKIAGSGTLDATSGNITATKADNVVLSVPEAAQTITKEGTVFECLLVPSEKDENKQAVTITLTIDGQVKTVTLKDDNGVIIARNTKSNITIGLSNTGISVSSVSIDDWNVVEAGGHKVTVKRSNEDGIANDVFLDVTSDGSTVTIKALAATNRFSNCTCTPAGKATCTPSIDKTTGICTFTISNVQEDITAEVGYLKYNATVVYDSEMGAVKLNGDTVGSGNPVQIYCGKETVLTLTAEAATGCRFLKWTDGSDKDLSTDNPYTISNVTSDITLKAVFGYEIAAVAKPVGAGTVTGAGVYTKGSDITLTATAGGSGVEFIGWVNKATPNDTAKTASININNVSGYASYVAVFSLKDALSGVFTVAVDEQGNPTKKVQFSKGNLYCSGVEFNSDGTVLSMVNAQWGFESNQYDTNPTAAEDRDESHISHFLWCNTAEKAMALTYNFTWNGESPFFAANNFTVNGFSGWSVLTGGTGGEWEYLLDKRETAYGKDRRYAAVKVNGMAGLLIFPDDFSWPDEQISEPQTFNTNSDNWNGLDYSVEEFAVLQKNGCVFLPAAGYRYGDSDSPNPASVYIVGIIGYYWSASPIDDINAYDLDFNSSNVYPYSNGARSWAQSVRLVTECQSEPGAE